jgi:hypothetical protein
MMRTLPTTLNDYLDGLRTATTAEDLEAAIQAPYKHSFRGPTWTRICNVREQRGREICDAHPLGRYVPRFGPGRRLTVCGETYVVGRGQNSTGIRYVWHAAEQFAMGVLMRNGFSRRAAHRVWGPWNTYPHRALQCVEDGLAGKFPDPPMNRLILSHVASDPINYSVARNDADKWDRRASRPCKCGGTRFDWGSGWDGCFTSVTWRCNGCARVYVEYVTAARLAEIRRSTDRRAVAP